MLPLRVVGFCLRSEALWRSCILEWRLFRRSVYTKAENPVCRHLCVCVLVHRVGPYLLDCRTAPLADTFSYFPVIFKQSTRPKLSALAVQPSRYVYVFMCLFIFSVAHLFVGSAAPLCIYGILSGERRKENWILCLTRPNIWHKSAEMRQWTLLNESAIKCRQSLITFIAHMLIMLRWGENGRHWLM